MRDGVSLRPPGGCARGLGGLEEGRGRRPKSVRGSSGPGSEPGMLHLTR